MTSRSVPVRAERAPRGWSAFVRTCLLVFVVASGFEASGVHSQDIEQQDGGTLAEPASSVGTKPAGSMLSSTPAGVNESCSKPMPGPIACLFTILEAIVVKNDSTIQTCVTNLNEIAGLNKTLLSGLLRRTITDPLLSTMLLDLKPCLPPIAPEPTLDILKKQFIMVITSRLIQGISVLTSAGGKLTRHAADVSKILSEERDSTPFGVNSFTTLALTQTCHYLLTGKCTGPDNIIPAHHCTLLEQTVGLTTTVANTTNTTSKLQESTLWQFLSFLHAQCNGTLTMPSTDPGFCLNYMNCPSGTRRTAEVSHIYRKVKTLSQNVTEVIDDLFPAVVNYSHLSDDVKNNLLLTILPCGIDCHQSVSFNQDQEALSRIVIQVFAWLTLVFTLVALVSFVVNRVNLNKYPTRIFVYINACYFLYSIVVIVQVTDNEWRNYSCHRDGTVRLEEPSSHDRDGNACAAMFMLNYFLLISSLFWWFCLTHAWYMTFKGFEDQGLKDNFKRYEIIYHCVVWPLAAGLGAGMLISKKVDGVPFYGVCFTNDTDTWFYFMSIPVTVVGVVGLPFLLLGTRMVVKFRKNMRKMQRRGSIRSQERLSRNEDGLRVFLGRMTIFIIGGFAHLLIQIAIAIYRQTEGDRWEKMADNFALCSATSCNVTVCEDFQPDPNFGVFVIVIVFIDMQGIILCLWAFSRQTWQEWKTAASRTGSRTSILLKRLSSHMLNTADLSSANSAMSTNSQLVSSSMSESFNQRERKTSENTRYNEVLTRNFQMSAEEFDKRLGEPRLSNDSTFQMERPVSRLSDAGESIDAGDSPATPSSTSTMSTTCSAERRRSTLSNRLVRFSESSDSDLPTTPMRGTVSEVTRPPSSTSNESSGSGLSAIAESPSATTPSKGILKKRSMSQSTALTPTTPVYVDDVFSEMIAAGVGASPNLAPPSNGRPGILRLARSPKVIRMSGGSSSEDTSPYAGRASPETRRDSIKRRSQSAGAELEQRVRSVNAQSRRAKFASQPSTVIQEMEELEELDSPVSGVSGAASPVHNGHLLSAQLQPPAGDSPTTPSQTPWRRIEDEVDLAEKEHRQQEKLLNGRRAHRVRSVVVETCL